MEWYSLFTPAPNNTTTEIEKYSQIQGAKSFLGQSWMLWLIGFPKIFKNTYLLGNVPAQNISTQSF